MEILNSKINRQKTEESEETKEGIISEKLPELSLDMSNEDIIELTTKWQREWLDSPKKTKWETQIKENEKYWLGKHYSKPDVEGAERPELDNLVFESLETFLPQATRRNPEPLVMIDSVEDSENQVFQRYVEKTKNRLADLADKNKIRLKLKKAARYWAIFQLGVAKLGWNLNKDIPTVQIVRPHKIILDPNAFTDEDGYNGDRIGEFREMPAYKILSLIEGRKESSEGRKVLEEKIKGDTGTIVRFIEWWTPEYMCWTLDNNVLLKMKNPHWNYDSVEEPKMDNGVYDLSDPNVSVDEFGNVSATPKEIKGINHFSNPLMPYEFLSVFNLGTQPMDDTSLIGQNLANQDLINRRNRQITKNIDNMNEGVIISGERSGLSKEQASGAIKAYRKGGAIWIPSGSPREAVERLSSAGLPSDNYNQLLDTRNRLRDIFGVRGSSSAGLNSEQTVRGKIISRGLDTDRIGGGLTEYLEQFADDIYNWFLQLLYVYDSDFQFIGGGRPPKVVISVKEGSLLPKDSSSIANQALELASMGKISNIDLFKRLEYPDPEELAANVWLETNAPHILYKDNPQVMEAIGMIQQQQAVQAQQEQSLAQAKSGKTAMEGESTSTLNQVPMR